MKFKLPSKIATKATSIAYKAAFQLKKSSPEIAIVVGIVGVVASTVMACKATTKLSGVMEENQKELDKIHKAGKDEEFKKEHNYTDSDYRRDVAIAYKDRAVALVKLYGPSVILGAASIGCIVFSHHVMRRRNAGLAAAYAALDSQFKRYRKNAIERFGEDVDKELRHGVITTVEDANGEKKEVTIIDPNNPKGYSDYARFFDENNVNWEKTPDYSYNFLKVQERYLNQRFLTRGFMFLNEVYEALGFDPTPAGQSVGWIYDENDPKCDNFISFGIIDVQSFNADRSRAFVNREEKAILLDFNVDGPIIERIKEWRR